MSTPTTAQDAASALSSLKATMTALINLEDSLLDESTASDSLADDVRRLMDALAPIAEELTLVCDCIPGSADTTEKPALREAVEHAHRVFSAWKEDALRAADGDDYNAACHMAEKMATALA